MHLVRFVVADVRVDLSAAREHHLPVNRVASDLGQDLVYSLFWQQAWARANKSFELRLNQSHDELTPYPRVFVYNLSAPISDWDPAAATSDEVYGKRIAFNGHLRDTNHCAFSTHPCASLTARCLATLLRIIMLSPFEQMVFPWS